MLQRAFAPAAVGGLLLAGFELAGRAFERAILAPNVGAEEAAFHTWITLAGAVLLASFLLIGVRFRDYAGRELWTIGATWTFFIAAAGCAAAGSGRSVIDDFDLSQGGLFGPVLVFSLTAPPLLGLLQRAQHRAPRAGRAASGAR